MDFQLNDDQRLLKDTVDRFIAERYSFDQRGAYARGSCGWSQGIWQQFADLGLLGLPFAESDGGLGLGGVEMRLVMESLGRGMVLEPYLATVVLCGGILRHGASATQRADWIPRIANGTLRLAFLHSEREARYELSHVNTRASSVDGGYRLDGAKCLGLHADSADRLIVSARLFGEEREAQGIALFIVDAHAPGLACTGYATQDGMRAADFTLTDVWVPHDALIGSAGDALPVIARVIDEAIAARCAEAVGVMDEALRLTVQYLKNRKQFGAAIGSFQALQHRAADMFVFLEQARSMAMFATMMAGSDNVEERRRAVSAAKIQIGRSGRFIGQQAVQLHGGIGMTMEYAVGHLFKRLTMIDTLFGNADYHLKKLSDSGGLIAAA